jgi:hypothetical protein
MDIDGSEDSMIPDTAPFHRISSALEPRSSSLLGSSPAVMPYLPGIHVGQEPDGIQQAEDTLPPMPERDLASYVNAHDGIKAEEGFEHTADPPSRLPNGLHNQYDIDAVMEEPSSSTDDVKLAEAPQFPPSDKYECRLILSGHALSISALKFSPDGAMLASSCQLLCSRCHDGRSQLTSVLEGSGRQDSKAMGRLLWAYPPHVRGAH